MYSLEISLSKNFRFRVSVLSESQKFEKYSLMELPSRDSSHKFNTDKNRHYS